MDAEVAALVGDRRLRVMAVTAHRQGEQQGQYAVSGSERAGRGRAGGRSGAGQARLTLSAFERVAVRKLDANMAVQRGRVTRTNEDSSGRVHFRVGIVHLARISLFDGLCADLECCKCPQLVPPASANPHAPTAAPSSSRPTWLAWTSQRRLLGDPCCSTAVYYSVPTRETQA